jgi:hypothetical protein
MDLFIRAKECKDTEISRKLFTRAAALFDTIPVSKMLDGLVMISYAESLRAILQSLKANSGDMHAISDLHLKIEGIYQRSVVQNSRGTPNEKILGAYAKWKEFNGELDAARLQYLKALLTAPISSQL